MTESRSSAGLESLRGHGAPRAIVVAEDTAARDAVSVALRDAGFEVKETEAFDVIVLDIPADAARIHTVGRLRIDLPRHEVRIGDRTVELTASEFRLLALLAERPGTVFTRRTIMEHVWGGPYFGDGHPVDTHILNLRRKIEADPTRPRRLLTVRGVGFKLVQPACEAV